MAVGSLVGYSAYRGCGRGVCYWGAHSGSGGI